MELLWIALSHTDIAHAAWDQGSLFVSDRMIRSRVMLPRRRLALAVQEGWTLVIAVECTTCYDADRCPLCCAEKMCTVYFTLRVSLL